MLVFPCSVQSLNLTRSRLVGVNHLTVVPSPDAPSSRGRELPPWQLHHPRGPDQLSPRRPHGCGHRGALQQAPALGTGSSPHPPSRVVRERAGTPRAARRHPDLPARHCPAIGAGSIPPAGPPRAGAAGRGGASGWWRVRGTRAPRRRGVVAVTPPSLTTRGGWVTGWAAGVGWGGVAGGGRSTARAGPVVRPLVGGGVGARVSPSAWRRHRLLPLTMGGRGPLRCGAGLWSLSWCCGQGRRQGTCALAVMKGNAPRRAAPANHAPTHRGAPRRQAQLLYRRLSRRLPDGLSCGLCHWRRP